MKSKDIKATLDIENLDKFKELLFTVKEILKDERIDAKIKEKYYYKIKKIMEVR